MTFKSTLKCFFDRRRALEGLFKTLAAGSMVGKGRLVGVFAGAFLCILSSGCDDGCVFESNCGANQVCLDTQCVRECSEQSQCSEGTACRRGGCTEGALEAGVDEGVVDAAVDAAITPDAVVDAVVDMDVVDVGVDMADEGVDGAADVGVLTDQGQPSDALPDDGSPPDGGPDLGPVDALAGLYALTLVVDEVDGGDLSVGDQIHRIVRLTRTGAGQYAYEARDSFGELILETAGLSFVAPEFDRYQFELSFPVAGRLGCVEVRFERGSFEGVDLVGRQQRDTESRGGDCSALLVHARLTSRWRRIGD